MIQYPEPTVGAVIYNPKGEVLLCKSHKWNNQFVLPGGHVELGEKMEDALRREIREETGLEVYDIRLVSLKECIFEPAFHEKKHFIFIDFECRTDAEEVVLNDEAQEFSWVALKDLEQYDVGGFTKELLMEIRNREHSSKRADIFYNF